MTKCLQSKSGTHKASNNIILDNSYGANVLSATLTQEWHSRHLHYRCFDGYFMEICVWYQVKATLLDTKEAGISDLFRYLFSEFQLHKPRPKEATLVILMLF